MKFKEKSFPKGSSDEKLGKDEDLCYDSPYRDPEVKEHTYHAVVEDSCGSIRFYSSDTTDGLKVGLSSLQGVKRILAVYAGRVIDFHEERNVVFQPVE